ncbi:hypothetical protein [Streptomyces pseudogriseolus]
MEKSRSPPGAGEVGGPGPGRYKANAEPGLTITRVVWRGES